MTRAGQLALIAAVAAVALAAGIVLGPMSRKQTAAPMPPVSGATQLISSRLPDMDGRLRPLAEWRGKVLVVNFWATWCVPCREEIPALVTVQEKWAAKGVQVVGIAIDETDKIRPYAAELKINYPILVGGVDSIELAKQAGNRLGGLPFTVVFNRQGEAVYTRLGGLDRQKLEGLVQSLL